MEKQQMKQLYRNPIVKVVCFRIENGFIASPGEPVESVSNNFEDVNANPNTASDLGNYFNF